MAQAQLGTGPAGSRNPAGVVEALTCQLGDVRLATGDYPAAAQVLGQALGICRDIGDRFGQAFPLLHIGIVRRETGDYPAAAQALDEALGIYCDLGDQAGELEVLNEKGTLHRISGDLAQARGCHQQALGQARAIASPWIEAHALAGLGRCTLAEGHTDEAADRLPAIPGDLPADRRGRGRRRLRRTRRRHRGATGRATSCHADRPMIARQRRL